MSTSITPATPAESATQTRTLTMARAQREAVEWEMTHNDKVFIIGEDVYSMGGVFGTSDGLGAKFGPGRIVNTPISETGFTGLATGAAMAGMHPIVELAYVDFVGVCFSQIVNFAAKTHYMSGGQVKVPMVLLTGTGGGYNNAAQHSQCLHATLAHMPGIKVVYPTNAYDAKGMMHTALRDENFVVFLIHKGTAGLGWVGPIIKTALAHVPVEDYTVPFGKAAVTREGTDVTIVTLGMGVHQSLMAAETLKAEGISTEILDLRSLVPLDRDAIVRSVRKTGRLVVVDEDYLSFGVSGEIVATVAERDPRMLRSAPVRVCMPDIPLPFSRVLENHVLPLAGRIAAGVRAAIN